MDTRKQLVCLFVLIGFLIPSLSAVVSAENPSEDRNFTEPHTGTDFPVGWDDLQLGVFEDQVEIRLVYPAMSSGEGKDMAGNPQRICAAAARPSDSRRARSLCPQSQARVRHGRSLIQK